MTANRVSRNLTILAIVAGFAATYCFLGYVMAGSLSVAAGDGRAHISAAIAWGVGGIACLAVAVGSALAVWRNRRRNRSADGSDQVSDSPV